MAKSSVHLNGNILAAVDVETTGFIAGFHDLWQVCVLPLDSNIKPSKDIMPFYMNLKVKRPENIVKAAIKLNNTNFYELQQRAIDPWMAADMFEEWFEALKLPIYKKICPLACNYSFDKSFLIDWLGHESYEQFFGPHIRDVMIAALYDNDYASIRANKVDYHHVSLAALCGKLSVDNAKRHDAMQDCLATAEVYRRLISERL